MVKTKPAIELGECRCIIDEKEIEEQLKSYNLMPLTDVAFSLDYFI